MENYTYLALFFHGMIDIQVKLHDKYSVEFKVGYQVDREKEVNEFKMNTWFFVPHSLDINASTYAKEAFYRDVRSNVRLITPVYTLEEIVRGEWTPFIFLEEAFQHLAGEVTRESLATYEYQIKMFASIFKSALRNKVNEAVHHEVEGTERAEHVERYAESVRQVARRYRELKKTVDVPGMPKEAMNYYSFGDEYLSNLVEFHTFRLLDGLREFDMKCYEREVGSLLGLVHEEISYKKKNGYLVAERESKDRNRAVIYRRGMLKKYAESDLFLKASKKKDGVLVEQIYYSLAAGLSMIFATVVAFSFQKKYGNFTMPLFVALVVSYMLKDRIKELMRFYFAHRLGKNYFDRKTTISMNDKVIGRMKEGMDFISERKVPGEIISRRARPDLLEADNRNAEEKIILYRKLIQLNSEALDEYSQYDIAGINEIIRFEVGNFVRKMDEREYELYVPDGDAAYEAIKGDKVYYVNFLIQLQHEAMVDYRRYRLVINRDGIQEIQKL